MLDLALASASRLGDVRLLAQVRSDLGFARYTAGRTAESLVEYEAATALVAGVDDPLLEAALALRRGYLQQDRGLIHQAVDLYGLAARRFDGAGHQAGVAHALAFQGWAALLLGQHAEAARLARAALEVRFEQAGWPPQVAAMVTLGLAIAQDEQDAALEHLRTALALADRDGHQHNQIWCLNYLGVVLRHAGRYEEALAHHRQAFGLLAELNEEQWAIDFVNSYGETCQAAGLRDEALRLHRQGLQLARQTGRRYEELCAHQGITAVLSETDPASAVSHEQAAAAIRSELGL
jgi:tetratricopeptide (TPR) repeat protein